MKSWQRRAIGVLTLGGGAIGIMAAITLFFARENLIEWTLCLAFLAVYAWGIWCGIKLLEGLPGSERSTLNYWLVQIPTFGSPVLGYFLSSGFHATVTLQIYPFEFSGNFLLGSTFNYSLLQIGQPWFVGVNLFAAFLAWWLSRLIPRVVS